MDSQNKTEVGALDGVEEKGGSQVGRARSTNRDLVLRMLALVLTLAAALALGLDEQTKTVPIQITDSLPPLNIPAHAKWHYLSAFVFFVVSNAIACCYAALSLLLQGGKKGCSSPLVVVVLDLLMVALLFSGNGAALAISLIGYRGNSHVLWNKVCNVFDKFCHQVALAVVLSLLGSIVFVLLVALASFRLHNKRMP